MLVLLCCSFNCLLELMKSEFSLSIVLWLYYEFVSTFIVASEFQTIFSRTQIVSLPIWEVAGDNAAILLLFRIFYF